ncbi:MAG: hypothetical protein HQL76_02225 [Magnetococcales bacterium]|nr:hypothetical protein [Magnetococcales bacterium]
MSRKELKDLLAKNEPAYSRIEDVVNLIVLKVVMFFNDDIDTAVAVLRKEFILEHATFADGDDLDPLGINMHRFSLSLLPEFHQRIEYRRFSSLKVQLELRTVLQHSWSEVKAVFDPNLREAGHSGRHANKLAQISYLLKTADDELVRIKEFFVREGTVALGEGKKSNEPVAKVPETVAPPPEPAVKSPGPASKGTTEPVTRSAEAELSVETRGVQEGILLDEPKQVLFMKAMEAFILDDSVVRGLDRTIADHYETKLVFKDRFVDSLVEIYLRIGIDSIGRIRDELVAHKQIVLAIMQHVFKDPEQPVVEFISKGASLLVLYYALLAETGNLGIIRKNLRDHAAIKGMSPEAFAIDLLNHYKKAIRKGDEEDL